MLPILALTLAIVAPPPCAHPVLAPGQEAAIARMVTPAQLPAGVRAGDTQVLRDKVRALFVTDTGVRIDYEIVAPTTAPPQAPRTARFAVQRVAPCLQQAAKCDVPTDLLRAMDQAVLNAVLVGEDPVQWACQEPAKGGLGPVLREVDAKLAVADRAGAEATLDVALRTLPLAQQPLAVRLDLASALWRLDRRPQALALLDGALQGWDSTQELQPVPLPPDLTALAERVAAAEALRGQPERGQAVLRVCRERGGQCSPVPMADALALAGQPTAAAAVLDAALQQPGVPAALFRARIGLASRQADGVAEVRAARAALQAFPDDLEWQEALAGGLFRTRQHAAAIATLEAVLHKDPHRPNVLGRIAGIFHDMEAGEHGQPMPGWQALRDQITQRAARDPNDVVAQFLQAVIEFYGTHFEMALARLQALEPRAPRDGRIFIYQAMANLWLGRDAEAERLVKRAMETNPHDPDVYYCLSQVVRKRDIAAGIAALERYVALSAEPGALEFPKKTERVRQELAILRQGKLPPLWDKPGHFSDDDARRDVSKTAWKWQTAVAAGLLALAVGVWLLLRRRRT